MHLRLERLERRSFMSATPALYAAGGGAYLTEFDPTTGAVLATITPPAGTGTGGITALAADQGGDVYVADASSGDILKVDATTHAASVFLTPAAFGMSEIQQMAVAGDGTLAIVAGNIQEFSPAGNLIANVAAGDYVGAGPDGLFYVFQTGISSLGFHTFVGQRYVPGGDFPVGPQFQAGMDYTTSDDPPAAFDFGADGNLYVTSNDFSGGIAPARDTGTLVISPATGTVTRSFDVDNHGGTDNHVAVDASGDLFVVNGDGGIDVRSTATGDVTRTLASASADKPFGQLLYAPVFVPTLSAPVAFTKGKAVQLATTAGRLTVRMAGPGTGEIVADPLVADGVVVSLSDTTTKSTFSLTGPAAATLAGVQSPAAINTLTVVHAATAGTLDFDSGLSRLNLAGLSGDVSVTGSQPLRVALGAVAGGSSLVTGGPVTSLSVASWGAGTTDDPSEISAVSIGTLVSRGEFSAQVKLTSAGLSLGRATFGSLAGASITMPGSAGIITVAGDMTDSQVMVGATYQAGTPSDQAIANFTGVPVTLKRFSQRATATFSDSDVGAYLIRSASTGRAVSTGGTLTGVAGHVIVSATVPPLNGGRALRNLNGVTSPRFYDESGVVVQAY